MKERIAYQDFPAGLPEGMRLAVAQINSWNRLMRSFGAIPGNFRL